jgi:hypothetical protein
MDIIKYFDLDILVRIVFVEYIYKFVVDINRLFRWTSKNGYLEIVKLLLKNKRVDLSDDNNYAIRLASGYI